MLCKLLCIIIIILYFFFYLIFTFWSQTALPTLDLFVDDRSVSNKIIEGFVSEDLVVTCHAWGALPPAHLTWKINDVPINVETSDLEFKNNDGKFDSTSILRFRPQSGHKNIACVNTIGEGYRIQEVGTVLVFEGKIL